MKIKNTYLFGEELDKNFWSIEEIKEITKKAQSKREELFKLDREYIIKVLDKTGKVFLDKNSSIYKLAFNHLKDNISFSAPMIEETISLIGSITNKNELNKRMSLEMFYPYALDTLMERHSYEGYLRAYPKGVVLHIGAGNVFLGILDSLIIGMLTKNVNIIKLSSSGSNFLNIFLNVLKENDKEKILSSSVAILSWKGGKKELEKEILKNVNSVFVWGGEEAVNSYKNLAPLGVKVEGFGPKTSFGIISKSDFKKENFKKLSKEVVKDVSMWDQSACSNMHSLYLLGEDIKDKDIKNFIEELSISFGNFQMKFPQGKLSIDEEVEITKARELAKIDFSLNESFYKTSFPNSHWTIIYEKKPFYRISPLNRVLYIKKVKNIKDLKKELLPLKGYLQSVGISANIIEKREIIENFYDLEIARFVPLGSMLEGKTGSPHDGIFPMMNLVNWVSLEGKPKNEDKLIEMVNFAREKSPFYKKYYSNNKKVLTLKDFQELPFLEKKHVLSNTPPESQDLLTSKAKRGIYFASGGSTGEPKYVFYNQHEYEHTVRMLAFAYEASGLNEDDVIANLFIAGNLWSSWLSVEKALAYTKCISVPVGSNLPLENIIKYLKDFKVTALIGLPSFLIKLTEYIDENSIKLPIKKVLYGGEYVGDEMIKFFQEVFPEVIVKSAGYATADAGVIGFQCENLSKGKHHVFGLSQYIEFIDPITLKPVKDGEIGELVVTSLNKKHMPIIRYRVGDLGRWILKPCSCGRKEKVFEILGRCDDRIHVGGAHLFVNDIQNAIGKVSILSFNFQVIIEKIKHKDNLKIIIESKKNLNDIEKNKVLNDLYKELYERCEDLNESVKMKWLPPPIIEILPVNSIERIKRTGKIKRVIDKRIKN